MLYKHTHAGTISDSLVQYKLVAGFDPRPACSVHPGRAATSLPAGVDPMRPLRLMVPGGKQN